MLARIRKSMQERDQGFTLIELLVVMIIIGILAAIAIPTFLNQRQKARETSAKSDVTTIGKELAAYYVDGEGELVPANAESYTPVGGDPISPAWTLTTTEDGAAPFTGGRLTAGNKVLASSTITSGTDYCVAVQSGYAEDLAGASSDKIWSYTQNGLQEGDCS